MPDVEIVAMSESEGEPQNVFRRTSRLTHAADFQRVLKRRATASDGRLVVFALQNGEGVTRMGLTVSRRSGGAAVRNRWKRRVREAFRTHVSDLPRGVDLVVMSRDIAAPLTAITDSLIRLAGQAAARLVPKSP